MEQRRRVQAAEADDDFAAHGANPHLAFGMDPRIPIIMRMANSLLRSGPLRGCSAHNHSNRVQSTFSPRTRSPFLHKPGHLDVERLSPDIQLLEVSAGRIRGRFDPVADAGGLPRQ